MSSLFLLIDIAPRDLLPSYKQEKEAVAALREKRNILIPTPGVNIEFQSGQGHVDSNTYEILKQLVQRNSPQADDVEWDKAVGIGHLTYSFPVGQNKPVVFRPLYIAQMPDELSNTMILIPVGQVSDMDIWLDAKHQGSLTLTAIILLLLGFFLQLVLTFMPDKATYGKVDKKQNHAMQTTPNSMLDD